jgi:hypothetical protein
MYVCTYIHSMTFLLQVFQSRPLVLWTMLTFVLLQIKSTLFPHSFKSINCISKLPMSIPKGENFISVIVALRDLPQFDEQISDSLEHTALIRLFTLHIALDHMRTLHWFDLHHFETLHNGFNRFFHFETLRTNRTVSRKSYYWIHLLRQF